MSMDMTFVNTVLDLGGLANSWVAVATGSSNPNIPSMATVFGWAGFITIVICIPIIFYKFRRKGFSNQDESWTEPLGTLIAGVGGVTIGIIGNFDTIKWRWGLAVDSMSEKFVNLAAKIPFTDKALPWNLLLNSLGILLFSLVIAGTLFFVYKQYDSHGKRQAKFIEGWDKIIAIHDDVLKEWASYSTDAIKVIDNPFMFDMRESMVCDFVAALQKANIVRPISIKTVSNISSSDTLYEQSVLALQTSFTALELESQKVQWGNFSSKEKKRIQTAKRLFNIALDLSSSESERQLAYKRAIKELQGLLTIPADTIAASGMNDPQNTFTKA